jgi:hypothetical protein
MEKYNIDYIVNTPDGRTEQLPNSPYPVQSENLETVMAQLSNGLPQLFGGIKIIGVKIEEAK